MQKKKIAVIAIHGIGNVPKNYAGGFLGSIKKRLGMSAGEIYTDSIHYQESLQDNENRVWKNYKDKLNWEELRKFILFGIADATGIEHDKTQPNSAYNQAQISIANALWKASKNCLPNSPILIVADSLGCHVLSCYIWDAQQYNRKNSRGFQGIWQNPGKYLENIAEKENISDADIDIFQAKNLTTLVTTGCNIPVFVASQANELVLAIEKPNDNFKWLNLYDKNDILGWPLKPLSSSYAGLVTDKQVSLRGENLVSRLFKSWNPLVHTLYWSDLHVKEIIADEITSLLHRQKNL